MICVPTVVERKLLLRIARGVQMVMQCRNLQVGILSCFSLAMQVVSHVVNAATVLIYVNIVIIASYAIMMCVLPA